jgi:hypothetical protein
VTGRGRAAGSDPMTEPAILDLARKIALDLFVNGQGEHADRLVLTIGGPPKRDLGGWGERVVVDMIADHLRKVRR